MTCQSLEVQNLLAPCCERLKQPALGTAGAPAEHDQVQGRGHGLKVFDHLASIGFIAPIDHTGAPADPGHDSRQCARAVATTPAVDQRLPVSRFVGEAGLQEVADIARDQCCTQSLGFERTDFGVHGADLGALRIIQNWSTDRSRQMVFGEFGGASGVNDRVEFGDARHHLID